MLQKRIQKRPRSQVRARPQVVHEDVRTQRQRDRGAANRAAILDALEELEDEIDEVLEDCDLRSHH